MRRGFLWGVVSVLLSVTSPVMAEIVAILENPGNGQSVSGITAISGWAFARNGQPVKINLRIDGVDRNDLQVLCCSSRQDVASAVEGAPPDTGFALLFSYGLLTPGQHSIGVRITALNEPEKIVDYPVTVVKPGARSSDPDPSFFSFLEQLSPFGGRGAIDDEEIILTGVTVTDNDAGGTRKATLRLLWTSNSQSFDTIEAASGTSFAGVQALFTNKCATSQCHDRTTAAENLDLSEGRAYRRTVAVRSDLDPVEPQQRFRVNPGKAGASYLYHKVIENGNSIAGTRMPPACPSNPSECLSAEEIQIISNWINEGAPPPQE